MKVMDTILIMSTHICSHLILHVTIGEVQKTDVGIITQGKEMRNSRNQVHVHIIIIILTVLL